MKQIVVSILSLACMFSCVASLPKDEKPLNQSNISRYCDDVFEEEIVEMVRVFHEAYYMARFITASPEEKIMEKYDDLRTGIIYGDGNSYTYDSSEFTFLQDDPLKVGGGCMMSTYPGYRSVSMTMVAETEWEMNVDSGVTMLDVTVVEADDDSMELIVTATGKKEENSPYNAKFKVEGMRIYIHNKKPAVRESVEYDGTMTVNFYEHTALIKRCEMTFSPGLSTVYNVI